MTHTIVVHNKFQIMNENFQREISKPRILLLG